MNINQPKTKPKVMMSAWINFFLPLLVASSSANAFQLPSSSSIIIPSSTSRRRHLPFISNPITNKSIQAYHLLLSNNLDTSTALYGKLWKRLQIEEGELSLKNYMYSIIAILFSLLSSMQFHSLHIHLYSYNKHCINFISYYNSHHMHYAPSSNAHITYTQNQKQTNKQTKLTNNNRRSRRRYIMVSNKLRSGY